MPAQIVYRAGYKYQLAKNYVVQTPIYPPKPIRHEFFTLDVSGRLVVMAGYAWDGASGPTFDTKSSMRPSLVHDCFCQMMKLRELDYETYSPHVHKLFRDMCVEDGMMGWRAWLWWQAVIVGRGGDPDTPDDFAEMVAP